MKIIIRRTLHVLFLSTIVIILANQSTTASEESLKKELIEKIIQSEITQYFKKNIRPAPTQAVIDIAKIADLKLNPEQIKRTNLCVEKLGKNYESFESSLRYGLTNGYTLERLKRLSAELKQKEIVYLLKQKHLAIQSGVDYLDHQSLEIDKMVKSPDIKWLKQFYQEPMPKLFFQFEFASFNEHIAARIKSAALCLMKELSTVQKKKLGQVADLQVKLISLDKIGNQRVIEDTYVVAIANAFKGKSESQFREAMKLIYKAKSEAVYFLTYVFIAQENALKSDLNILK